MEELSTYQNHHRRHQHTKNSLIHNVLLASAPLYFSRLLYRKWFYRFISLAQHKKELLRFFRAHNSDNTQFIHQRLIAVDLEFITFHPNPRKKSKRERELEWMNKICFFSVCMSSIRALLCISKWPRTTEKKHSKHSVMCTYTISNSLWRVPLPSTGGVVKVFLVSPSINSDALTLLCSFLLTSKRSRFQILRNYIRMISLLPNVLGPSERFHYSSPRLKNV